MRTRAFCWLGEFQLPRLLVCAGVASVMNGLYDRSNARFLVFKAQILFARASRLMSVLYDSYRTVAYTLLTLQTVYSVWHCVSDASLTNV